MATRYKDVNITQHDKVFDKEENHGGSFIGVTHLETYRKNALKEEGIKGFLLAPRAMDAIEQLMIERGIPSSDREAFAQHIDVFVEEVKRREALATLPEKPLRDIRRYEGVIGYIKSPEGLGPWLEAGVLTRKMMNELSPRAYISLANWLKNPRHSLEQEGLDLPKQSELTDKALAEQEAQGGPISARLVSAKHYRNQKAL